MITRRGTAELDGQQTDTPQARSSAHRSYWLESWTRLTEDHLGVSMALLLIVFATIGVVAPVLAHYVTHYDPDQQDLLHSYASPGPHHWFGTDQLGRDLLTRLLYGARATLGTAGLTMILALSLGSVVGIVAGHFRGWVDELLMRFLDIALAIPALFFFILLSILFRPGPFSLALIIASVSWMSIARLIRAEVLKTGSLDFMLASRSVGGSDWWLMTRHLVPAVIPVMVVAASIAVGQIMLIEAALDFLGLGIRPPTPSWGNMVADAQDVLSRSGWIVLFPGSALFLSVLASILLGNSVRDAFDPRLR